MSDGSISEDNVFKVELTGGLITHAAQRVFTTAGKSYRITCKYYIPTSNVSIDNIKPRWLGGSNEFFHTLDVTGAWTDAEFSGTSTGNFAFYAADGANVVPNADGDVFYIKDVIFEEISGNHFTQVIPANRPVIDNATIPTKTTFEENIPVYFLRYFGNLFVNICNRYPIINNGVYQMINS